MANGPSPSGHRQATILLLTLGGGAVSAAGAWAVFGGRLLLGMGALFLGAVLIGIGIGVARQRPD